MAKDKAPPSISSGVGSDADSEPATVDVVPGLPLGPLRDEESDDDGDAQTADLPATQSASRPARSQPASAPRSMPSMPKVGIPRSLQKWDRYQVIKVLGSGGMGAVYMARDPRLNRLVALKIVHPMLGHADGSTGAVFVKRFEREARLQASLDHPHICKVYEIGEMPSTGEDAGYPYIAMQLISGKPLHIAQHEMSLFEKVQVIQQVADAMHAAHRQGLIHRDIKPSNIMVERTSDGKFHPYVMDFGLARETAGSDQSRSGIIEGTPRFMAPEQARGDTKHLDRRTDVYALGVTLYEILAGRSPYDGSVDIDILLAVLTVEPKPLRSVDATIPPDLEAITLKCLEKEQAARYDSAKALADDLKRFIDGEPVQARRIGLFQRLYRRARKHKALVGLGTALLLSLLGLLGYGLRTRLQTMERERQAQKQAELAQRLGQEISQMEWLLRSARQLPLHDLEREKGIIRRRMQRLQEELSSYGGLGKGLGHYALGRGHLALHEYPQALKALLAAQDSGNVSADVHYALGLVLGKHYEQAMYEARLSGGGDWAEKRLLELRPRYLLPAIESLQKSRALASDTPGYLEAMIAFYRRDYDGALQKAKAAVQDAPWLYEAEKLQGDIHLERALAARDSGKDDDAKREFGSSVAHYQAAAKIGQSDGEVYEGLAEAWVRQVEMAATRGQPTEEAYAAAIETSDKISATEPASTAGPLKKAYAALLTMAISGSGTSSVERVQKCMLEAQAVLAKEPENPYASDVAAGCNAFAADSAQGRGEDPEPLFRRAIALLEPAIARAPYFLWGINDLASTYLAYASYLQLHGHPETRNYFGKAISFQKKAMSLDDNYLIAKQNALYTIYRMVMIAQTQVEMDELLKQADALYGSCIDKNNQFQQCNINYLAVYIRATQRLSFAQKDIDSRLERARQTLERTRKIGGSFLDLEQNAALFHVLDAQEKLLRRQDAATALLAAEQTIKTCLGMNGQDAMCRTLAAQRLWLDATLGELVKQPTRAALLQALDKALDATKSPETYPDAWQTVAETYLRLLRSDEGKAKQRAEWLLAGKAATAKVFAVNPNHALGLATLGELELWSARSQPDASLKLTAAEAARKALTQAVQSDPLLTGRLGPLLLEARKLATR